MNQNFDAIFPLILAILLIFVFPVLLRRRGMDYGDLAKLLFRQGLKRDPDAASSYATSKAMIRKSSGSHALTEFAGELLAFSRRHKTGLVYPGTVSWKGETATLLAIVVTKSRAIGVNCFGFSGVIRDKGSRDKWLQTVNGQASQIPNPLSANAAQDQLLRQAFNENGLSGVPCRTIAVFTSPQATLLTSHPDDVMIKKDFIRFLKELAAEESPQIDADETARKIFALVERRKS